MELTRTGKGSTLFKHQRITAVMLAFLMLFFLWNIVRFYGAPRQEIIQWIRNPFMASVLILTLMAAFYHGFLGLKMVIEDYIHCKNLRWACLFVLGSVHVFLSILSILLILWI